MTQTEFLTYNQALLQNIADTLGVNVSDLANLTYDQLLLIAINEGIEDLSGGGGVTSINGTTGAIDIKTLNGTSLLGTGNIAITKNDVGLGTVDNTSDINKPISTATQTALNTKQDTLVSGTNIKTINGTSLLGSGDVAISGGGSTGYSFDERNFSAIVQNNGFTPFGFRRSNSSGTANWLEFDAGSILSVTNAEKEDLGVIGGFICQIFSNSFSSFQTLNRYINYNVSSTDLLEINFVLNGSWNTNLRGNIGLFPSTFYVFNLNNLLSSFNGISIYFDNVAQRFVCRCRNGVITQSIFNAIPLSSLYWKFTITIGNNKVDFKITYLVGSTFTSQTITINTNIPNQVYFFGSSNHLTLGAMFENNSASSLFTPNINRISLKTL